jgi:hypothetical protein
MKYTIRLNIKAWNPLTSKVDTRRVWEVEQAQNKDSASAVWHCANVIIRQHDGKEIPIIDLFAQARLLQAKEPKVPGQKRPPIEFVYWGIVMRGQDDAIVIQEGRSDVQ